ncbi:MAG: hypothetical protein AB7E31_15425 [Desulfitobacterium sp.]
MLKRPVIESKYVDKIREIHYLGNRDDLTEEQASAFLAKGHDKLYSDKIENDELGNDELGNNVLNNGHIFQILPTHIDKPIGADSIEAEFIGSNSNEVDSSEDSKFEVVGWINWTQEFPYDFLLRQIQTNKHFVATLKGRTDGWPLFAIQDGKPTCSRSRMGSDWSCRMCVKYFGITCKGR